jgi:hypothetical protein
MNLSYEQVAFLRVQVFVNGASGAFLDDLGLLFRLQREEEEPDDRFRSRILSYWAAVTGGSTIDSIKASVADALGQTPDDVTVTEIPDLKFRVSYTVPELGVVINTIKEVVNRAKAAGTYAYFNAQTTVATEGVSVAENVTFQPFFGILVSFYEIGSASVI